SVIVPATAKLMVSCPGVASARVMASRSEPLPLSARFVTVKVDGTLRSSSGSRDNLQETGLFFRGMRRERGEHQAANLFVRDSWIIGITPLLERGKTAALFRFPRPTSAPEPAYLATRAHPQRGRREPARRPPDVNSCLESLVKTRVENDSVSCS